MKKLTIITICYNEPNLEKTCESIVNQTWQDFEWIVVDGGSNKETQKIWDKYKYRIDKFISEPDDGRYNAMNKGIRIANGRYLNFLNAGDYYFYNDALKDVFYNNTFDEDILYANECFINGTNILDSHIQPMPKNLTKEFLFYSTIRHQASFIRRELFDKYGLYNEKYKVVSDYEKWFIFLENNVCFRYLPYTVTYFNTFGISCNKRTIKIALDERNSVINKFFTNEEIKRFNKSINYSFIEKLFSIKNNLNKSHKIITILGIHIKIKRGNK